MNQIEEQIRHMASTLLDPRNDGFTQWESKKNLYEILFQIEDILSSSPNFGITEEKFLNQIGKEKVWKVLSS
jgi:hypothetical protein